MKEIGDIKDGLRKYNIHIIELPKDGRENGSIKKDNDRQISSPDERHQSLVSKSPVNPKQDKGKEAYVL